MSYCGVFFCWLWFRPAGRGTFFCFAKRKYPKKRRPSSLAYGFPRVGAICKVGLIRRPCLKQTLLEHPVLGTRKITSPLGSSEGEVGATANQWWGSDQVTRPL